MSNYTKHPLVSFVWPGNAVFPDLLTDGGVNLWNFAMEEYYKVVKYDGIWIDMNEPAMIVALNNCRGEMEVEDWSEDYNLYEHIPYIPGYRKKDNEDSYNRLDIRTHTMSENAYSLTNNKFHHSYNFKPLMAYLQAKVTNEYLVKPLNKRPFVLSRSTVLGMGKVSFHWLGDNNSNVQSMRNGVNGIFSFNVFGIPMVGDDICGFNDNVSNDLCARWMALGAFFPFARNHNSINNRAQDPFSIGKQGYDLSKMALQYRYSLLRYYYTQMFFISQGKSGSFFKPAFFEFPQDLNCYEEIDGTAMLGPALYLIPIYKTEIEDIQVYFPNANWNEYGTWNEIATEKKDTTEGTQVTINTAYKTFVYLRGGFIVPRQDTSSSSSHLIRTTYDLQQNPTELVITPDSINNALGDIVFDYDNVDTLSTLNYSHIHLNFKHDQLLFSVENQHLNKYDNKDIYLSKIRILRSKYLIDEEKLYAEIKDIKGNVYYYRLYPESSSLLLDISKTKFKLDSIASITFIKNGLFFLQ